MAGYLQHAANISAVAHFLRYRRNAGRAHLKFVAGRNKVPVLSENRTGIVCKKISCQACQYGY